MSSQGGLLQKALTSEVIQPGSDQSQLHRDRSISGSGIYYGKLQDNTEEVIGGPGVNSVVTSLAGITAHAGGGQTDATLLTETKSRIDHAANDGDSVLLKPLVYNATIKVGTFQLVQNRSGKMVNVFPQVGEDLGNGINTPFALADGNDFGVQSYLTGTGTY